MPAGLVPVGFAGSGMVNVCHNLSPLLALRATTLPRNEQQQMLLMVRLIKINIINIIFFHLKADEDTEIDDSSDEDEDSTVAQLVTTSYLYF